MTFEADLKSHLQVAAVAAFVADRIYPEIVPQGAGMPAITYSLQSGELQNSLDGFTSGLSRFPIQIDCWAATKTAVNALALVVRDRMNTNPSTFKIIITNYPLFDDYEPDTKRYRRSMGCSCWFSE